MPTLDEVDALWMRRAIVEARIGQAGGEWPFGAVVVSPIGAAPQGEPPRGIEVSAAHSSERCTGNPAGHAELHAIEQAGLKHGRLLRGLTLYTTHEPCVMCSGLILQAKLSRVVVGTLRAYRADLFNPGRDAFEDVLARNANPAFPIRVDHVGKPVLSECLALFDGMVDAAAA